MTMTQDAQTHRTIKISQRKRKQLLSWIARSSYLEQKEQCLGRGVKIHVSLNVNIISWKRNIKRQTYIFLQFCKTWSVKSCHGSVKHFLPAEVPSAVMLTSKGRSAALSLGACCTRRFWCGWISLIGNCVVKTEALKVTYVGYLLSAGKFNLRP